MLQADACSLLGRSETLRPGGVWDEARRFDQCCVYKIFLWFVVGVRFVGL